MLTVQDALACLKGGTGKAMVDLRIRSCDDVIAHVERRLSVRLDREAAVVKRRSVGARTDRGTWVRIEARPLSLVGQGGGMECAACLPAAVARPAWHQGLSWQVREHGLLWRADETELVTASPIQPGGVLCTDPGLTQAWWARMRRSLCALAAHSTIRVATPHTVPVDQQRVRATIEKVFGSCVETTVTEWTVAHADLAWVNVTAPECWLLDWEDWGMAPRGWDAATLWGNSLAVPALAARVQREYQADLNSRPGLLSQLFFCAEIIAAGDCYAGPLAEPARREATRLINSLC